MCVCVCVCVCVCACAGLSALSMMLPTNRSENMQLQAKVRELQTVQESHTLVQQYLPLQIPVALFLSLEL